MAGSKELPMAIRQDESHEAAEEGRAPAAVTVTHGLHRRLSKTRARAEGSFSTRCYKIVVGRGVDAGFPSKGRPRLAVLGTVPRVDRLLLEFGRMALRYRSRAAHGPRGARGWNAARTV